jgi:DNA polymerase I
MYGMGYRALSKKLGIPEQHARDLLQSHRNAYPKFWAWSEAAVNHARLKGYLAGTFGWPLHTKDTVSEPSIRNFPMQANGAEMLRLACCFATEAGIRVCAPVHDAILIEATIPDLEEATAATIRAMDRASEAVLAGLRLRTEAIVIHYPDRLLDARGRAMWSTVMRAIDELRVRKGLIADHHSDCAGTTKKV